MANRRMFSKTITNSSKFLRQPATAQQLYFHLGMNGDDDGFVEWYTVITMTRTSEQDLQVLQANGFVQVFDDRVLLIKDWKENNFIRPDRYTQSKYLETYKEQLGKDLVYQIDTSGIPHDIPVVNQRYTQDRIELGKSKDRVGKDTKESNSNELEPVLTNGYTKWQDEFKASLGFAITKEPKKNENAIKAIVTDHGPEVLHQVLGYLHWLKTTRRGRERPHWFQYVTSFIKIRQFWDNIQACMTDDAYQQTQAYGDFFTR
jgi:hypothetical protein